MRSPQLVERHLWVATQQACRVALGSPAKLTEDRAERASLGGRAHCVGRGQNSMASTQRCAGAWMLSGTSSLSVTAGC